MTSVQTQVLENGQWVTRILTAEELMGANGRNHPPPPPRPVRSPPHPPRHGLLTRTIIDSPVIRWVHPAQLRSSRFNDVALVGDTSVQICEFGTDMELRPVAARLDLGSRIRNCRVMGTHEYLKTVKQDIQAAKLRSDDVDMADAGSQTSDIPLFQQILVLVLCTGELVILFMTPTATGGWEFVSSVYTIANGRLLDPGYHMAISPDNSYLALSCSEGFVVVYELETIEEIRKRHSQGLPITPFRSKMVRACNGIILQAEFLFPEHHSQVVLLIITARAGIFRLVIYEWHKLEPLSKALATEKRGHRLDESAGMPLLVIPLTVRCQFLMVTEHSLVTYTDVLSGPPTCNHYELKDKAPTAWYHGSHHPMWTAWARPMREESYLEDTDVIWLAREDGWVSCLEIRGECGVDGSVYLGPLEVNIDSTFAFLSIPGGGDVLVVVGGHGPGGIWTVRPREIITPVDKILNWSPTTDMVLLTRSNEDTKADQSRVSRKPRPTEKARARSMPPDRVFSCMGRGTTGAIVELRYGMQANIGLDLAYPSLIRRCWAIPNFEDVVNPGFFMLLSLPDRSALLHISHDHTEVSERDQGSSSLDLLSPTLAVHVSENLVIQITTANVTLISAQSSYQHSISDMIDDPLATVTHAAVTSRSLALSLYSASRSKIRRFAFDNTRFVAGQVIEVDGEVTALSLNTIAGGDYILAGLWREDQAALTCYGLGHGQAAQDDMLEAVPTLEIPINPKSGESESDNDRAISAVTSIVCLDDDKVLVGLRNGEVLSIQSTCPGEFQLDSLHISTNFLGSSPSYVYAGIPLDEAPSVLVCNDAGLAIIKHPGGKPGSGRFEQIFRVWPIDASDRSVKSPTIHSVASLRHVPDFDHDTLVMVSGSRILLTQLRGHVGPVPWYIPVGGTPKGLLYAERLNALVTTVTKNGVLSLHFLDPDTGADLSRPVIRESNKDGSWHYSDVDYIAKMGVPGDKVASLVRWNYKEDVNIYEWFVLVTTRGEQPGHTLLISTKHDKADPVTGQPRRIRFWTQFASKMKEAKMFAAAPTDAGIFLSSDKAIEYRVIERNKLQIVQSYSMPSPAIHLDVVEGCLNALTSHHSLVRLDYSSKSAVDSQTMELIHTDDTARHGLYSIDLSSMVRGLGDQEHLALVSDPMCRVYGLWSPGPKFESASFRLTFQAGLKASMRRFVRGRTRPQWTRDQPYYGRLRRAGGRDRSPTAATTVSSSGEDSDNRTDGEKKMRKERVENESVLGLALDGSLTQFSILDEDEWRLFKFIQNPAMSSKEICVVTRNESSSAAAFSNRNVGNNNTQSSQNYFDSLSLEDAKDTDIDMDMAMDTDMDMDLNVNVNTDADQQQNVLGEEEDEKEKEEEDVYGYETEDEAVLFETQFSAGPEHMHVDGDVLHRILTAADGGALERLIPRGTRRFRQLRELLDKVLVFEGEGEREGGEGGGGVDEDRVYEVTYALLEYFVAPAV
ncbi:hypothetical protein F5Y17DRAFT_428117 [Xylariaceae sp. FL0594]|nr:hypothetical protein F5Y17DRAFT_428117 [Xylariaceae sp. FL0594]